MQGNKPPFFMHPPFGKWDDKIVEMIERHFYLSHSRRQIMQKALTFPPLLGWDDEALSLVRKALDICFEKRRHA